MMAWPATSLLPHVSRINCGCDFLRREANTFSIVARCPQTGQAVATQMLLRSPPDRPEGGGSRGEEIMGRITMNELEMLVEALGIQLEKERRSAVLAAFQPMAQEIAKLRSLDLTDVHPAVVFSPVTASQQR